jgi:K+-transporting ATPase ATPase C chain
MNRSFASELTTQIRISIVATIVMAVICCGVYPAIVWGVAQAVFPNKANGSLIKKDGTPTNNDAEAVGSALLGQPFAGAKYFHPRPSAAGNGYDATASGGSNLGPTSTKLLEAVRQRAQDYRRENNLAADAIVPPDAVTASASGLDPHISVANANLQAKRVADVRKIPVDRVNELIAKNTEGPDLGIFGDPGVNVLKLNVALDNLR